MPTLLKIKPKTEYTVDVKCTEISIWYWHC